MAAAPAGPDFTAAFAAFADACQAQVIAAGARAGAGTEPEPEAGS